MPRCAPPMISSPPGQSLTSCFSELLASLQATSHKGCLRRADYTRNLNQTGADASVSQLPMYVLHVASLWQRHEFMESQLAALGAADVTWVLCADRIDVERLSANERQCMYPCMQANEFTLYNGSYPWLLSNGTLSLALKHKLAHLDIARRGVPGIVLEDDALVSTDFWLRLSHHHVPKNADIFWLASHTERRYTGNAFGAGHAIAVKARGAAHEAVYARNASAPPRILGGTAYIIWPSGAEQSASQPITTAADIALSYHVRPGAFYGPAVGDVIADGSCCASTGDLLVQRPPVRQYGPHTWLITPLGMRDRATAKLGGNTHY